MGTFNLKWFGLCLWSVYGNCGMLNTISSSSTTYASKTFLCIKTDYNDVTSGTRIVVLHRRLQLFQNKKCYTFFKEALRVSTQTIRTGSQDCSTKKKVSVLIINSLLHAVMSSIHCAGAGYYFFKGHARGTREGEGPPLLFSPRASLRLLP